MLKYNAIFMRSIIKLSSKNEKHFVVLLIYCFFVWKSEMDFFQAYVLFYKIITPFQFVNGIFDQKNNSKNLFNFY